MTTLDNQGRGKSVSYRTGEAKLLEWSQRLHLVDVTMSVVYRGCKYLSGDSSVRKFEMSDAEKVCTVKVTDSL